MPDSSAGSEDHSPQAVMWPDSSGRSLVIQNLHKLHVLPRTLDWQIFYPGVHVHWLYRDGDHGSAAAFIRFQPGGRVPLHEEAWASAMRNEERRLNLRFGHREASMRTMLRF